MMSGGVAWRRPLRVRSDLSIKSGDDNVIPDTFLLFGHDGGEDENFVPG